MSQVRRSIATVALSLLTMGVAAPSITAAAGSSVETQTTAIKDGWLVMKLHSQFVPEDALSGSNIDVDVKAGMVTLQGTVPNEAARARAIAVAKASDGVKGVTDQLRIAPAQPGMDTKAVNASKKTGRAIDDGWIKSKIYAQYLADWNDVLADSDIDLDIDKGVVTLNGTVKSATARTRAVSIAKGTDGVKSVKDLLKVSVGTSNR